MRRLDSVQAARTEIGDAKRRAAIVRYVMREAVSNAHASSAVAAGAHAHEHQRRPRSADPLLDRCGRHSDDAAIAQQHRRLLLDRVGNSWPRTHSLRAVAGRQRPALARQETLNSDPPKDNPS